MEFSIKSPNAFLWKTGYRLDQVMDLYHAGKLLDDWLICPLGDASHAVIMSEFVKNTSIFKKEHVEASESIDALDEKRPMSVALMGWTVFFGALLSYFFLTIIAKESIPVFMGNLGSSNAFRAFIVILVKGIEALIFAGAIVALLGHAYEKIIRANK